MIAFIVVLLTDPATGSFTLGLLFSVTSDGRGCLMAITFSVVPRISSGGEACGLVVLVTRGRVVLVTVAVGIIPGISVGS